MLVSTSRPACDSLRPTWPTRVVVVLQVERSNVKNEGMRAVLEREANAQRLVQLQVTIGGTLVRCGTKGTGGVQVLRTLVTFAVHKFVVAHDSGCCVGLFPFRLWRLPCKVCPPCLSSLQRAAAGHASSSA